VVKFYFASIISVRLHLYEKREGSGAGSVPLTNGSVPLTNGFVSYPHGFLRLWSARSEFRRAEVTDNGRNSEEISCFEVLDVFFFDR
jgi:hypothetical protein